MKIDVEKIIKGAFSSWEYALRHAEWVIEEYRDKGENVSGSELFLALNEAAEVVSNTSSGSIYHSLMESSDLETKYKGKFVELWARAKEIRSTALKEINNLLEEKKK